jgi:hypothetical protein
MDEKDWEHLVAVSDKNLDMHQETKNISHKAINNIIFAVSTGTLVVSITFIGNIKDNIIFSNILIISWLCLISTIALNFIAHRLMIKQSSKQIELLNEERKNKFSHGGNYVEEVVNENKELEKIVVLGQKVNVGVLITLSIGMLFLVWFVSLNLAQKSIDKKQNIESRETNVTKVIIIKNYYPN